MKFGESVRLFRQQKGLTQEKLGELLGVSSQAVSKWETMESYPDAELLVPLANALEVSLDVLFHNEQVMFLSYSQDSIHIASHTGIVHRHDDLGAGGD